jgi:transcriptional regulator with XRE-family HTH domain
MTARSASNEPASPAGLAGRLKALRLATQPRISQTAAGRALGTSQNKISRVEAGEQLLTPEEVATLARLYGAPVREVRALEKAARALAARYVDSRLILRRGGGTLSYQRSVADAEAAAGLVRSYQPTVVLGVLQTADYAAVMFGPGHEADVAVRMERNRALVEEPSRRWVLVQTEGALLWNVAGAEVMAAQIDKLIDTSRLPNVDLRIITHRQVTPIIPVGHGFHLYDRSTVQIGTLSGSARITDPGEVDRYSAKFDELADVAAAGDAARAELERIREVYRAD